MKLIQGLRIFPEKNFRDIGNAALSRKKMGIRDEYFQSGTQECVDLHFENTGNCKNYRNFFPGIQDFNKDRKYQTSYSH